MAIYTALTRNMNFGFKRHNGLRFVLQGMPTLQKYRNQHLSARAESHEVKTLLCSGRLSLVINCSFSLFSIIPEPY